MNDTERQEWSRHYDKLSWVIAGIFYAAVGFLALRSVDCDTSPIYTNTGGLMLSFAGLYYFSAFRGYRDPLHGTFTNPQLRAYFTANAPYPVPTWHIMLYTFFVLDALFITNLAVSLSSFISDPYMGYWIIWAFGIAMMACVLLGLRDIRQRTDSDVLKNAEDVRVSVVLFEGTAVPLDLLFSYLEVGKSWKEFRKDYPAVGVNQINHAIAEARAWLRKGRERF